MSRKERVSRVLRKTNEGFSYGEIANELNMSYNTVKSWVRRYGDKYQAEQEMCEEDRPAQISLVANPEFDSIEICELPETIIRRIFLVCGTGRFGGKYDQFASQVPQMLEYNLQIGDVFVFCNRSRYQLSILQWQGDGFVLMFRRTEEERYLWPRFFNSKAVEITRSDLEMLLEYPRFMRRLRGLPTPEFLG